jgi:hypothetical protein
MLRNAEFQKFPRANTAEPITHQDDVHDRHDRHDARPYFQKNNHHNKQQQLTAELGGGGYSIGTQLQASEKVCRI